MPPLDVTDARYTKILTGLTGDLRRVRLALGSGHLTQALAHALSIEHVATLAGMADVRDLSAGLGHAILEAAGGRPAALSLAVDRLAQALEGHLNGGLSQRASTASTRPEGQAHE